MKSEVLALFPYVQATGVAMLLFLISFIGIAVIAFMPSRKSTYDTISTLPLEEY